MHRNQTRTPGTTTPCTKFPGTPECANQNRSVTSPLFSQTSGTGCMPSPCPSTCLWQAGGLQDRQASLPSLTLLGETTAGHRYGGVSLLSHDGRTLWKGVCVHQVILEPEGVPCSLLCCSWQITFVSSGCSSDGRCRSNLAATYKFCSRKRENGKDVFKSLAR